MDVRAALAVAAGRIQIDPMLTHVISHSAIKRAFDLMKKGWSIRLIVRF